LGLKINLHLVDLFAFSCAFRTGGSVTQTVKRHCDCTGKVRHIPDPGLTYNSALSPLTLCIRRPKTLRRWRSRSNNSIDAV